MSILRIKRKCEENPKEILILTKKGKIEDVKEEASIFQLTKVAVQKKDIDEVISKKFQGFETYKQKKFDLQKITNHLRTKHLQQCKLNRLEVVNCKRNITKEENTENVTIIDLSSDENKNEQEDGYVYDVYYSSKIIDPTDDDFVKNCSVHEVDSMVWQEKDNSSEDENVEDEDNSNDESNWRNDYPDEDECVTDDDEDGWSSFLSRKLERTNLSEYSLSSDEFDESVHDILFNSRRNDDFDYFNEVMSDDSDSS